MEEAERRRRRKRGTHELLWTKKAEKENLHWWVGCIDEEESKGHGWFSLKAFVTCTCTGGLAALMRRKERDMGGSP